MASKALEQQLCKRRCISRGDYRSTCICGGGLCGACCSACVAYTLEANSRYTSHLLSILDRRSRSDDLPHLVLARVLKQLLEAVLALPLVEHVGAFLGIWLASQRISTMLDEHAHDICIPLEHGTCDDALPSTVQLIRIGLATPAAGVWIGCGGRLLRLGQH